MKILIVTPYYCPDLGASAPLFSMLSKELERLGHEVTVIAMVPHYPGGRVSHEYKNRFIQRSSEDGVEVARIRIPSIDRSNLALRYLQTLFFQIGASAASLRDRYDVALFTNPGMGIWLPFFLNVTLRKIPAIFSIHDLYPHVGISLGIFRNRFVVSVVTWLEKYCLHRAESVRILTESFRAGMHELGVPDEKISLLYDWVDIDLIQPMPAQSQFLEEYNLQEKFVVMYAGNLGLSQGLEHVLTAAEKLSDKKDIHFALVGEGAARKQLIELAKDRKISNVTFIPFQPRERLPDVLAAADISLVTLRTGVGVTALPSKTYSIFASGRPILASVDDGCETARLVNDSKAGICIEPDNPDALVEKILYLKQNPELREKMGVNGRIWAENNHSPQSAAREIERLSRQVITV